MSSKRKNPLLNLDEFLRQEASTLVTPKKFSEPEMQSLQEEEKSGITSQKPKVPKPTEASEEYALQLLQELAGKNGVTLKQQLLNLLKDVLEDEGLDNSKDKMLMNTLLYLQHTANWREVIADYWSKENA